MARSSKNLRELTSRISRAQAQFKASSFSALTPHLHGAALTRTMAREQLRSDAFIVNSRSRLARDVAAVESAGLSSVDRNARLGALARRERRYLEQHIAAATRRMKADAEMARLQERGEPGAVWVLGRRRTHTADCLAMAGRLWSWDVLAEVNPSNRHAGCGCRLVSEAQARAWGIPVRMGRRSPRVTAARDLSETLFTRREGALIAFTSPCVGDLRELGYSDNEVAVELLEGIDVPVHVRAHTKMRGGKLVHVKEYVRYISVDGDLPRTKDFNVKLDTLLDAAERGDMAGVEKAHADLRKSAESIRKPASRHSALGTVDRIRTAVFNPTGEHPVGQHPLAPIEGDGQYGPWGPSGSFEWTVEGDDEVFGAQHDYWMERLKNLRYVDVKQTKRGAVLSIRKKNAAEEHERQKMARELEIALPQLRGVRTSGGSAVDHDAPLEVHDDEPKASSSSVNRDAHQTKIRNINWGQQGDAAELGGIDMLNRLKEQGLIDEDAEWEMTNEAAQKNDPFDWILGRHSETCYVAEVKAHSYRDLVEGNSRALKPGIGKGAKARKIRDLIALNKERKDLGLKPAIPLLVQSIVDYDNDRQFLVMTEYGKVNLRDKDPSVFTARRVPVEIVDAIMAGTIKPGEMKAASRGDSARDLSKGTRYVGAFKLRFNPLRMKDAGQRLTDFDEKELKRRVDEPKPRIDGPSADAGTRMDRTRLKDKPGGRRAELAQRDAEILDLARKVAAGESDLTQTEIGDRFGVKQSHVSKIINRHNKATQRPIVMKRGARRKSGVRRA